MAFADYFFKPTKEQRKHLRTIRWLFSDAERQSGRTTLLAYGLILQALQFPGRPVQIQDHVPGFFPAKNNMLPVLESMLVNSGLPYKIDLPHMQFVIDLK